MQSLPPFPLPNPNDVPAALRAFAETAFKLDRGGSILEKPIAGTTLYLATCTLDLRYGTFTVHVFQDIIHKGYVLALTYGDAYSGQPLYCRIHSSCVTSETLRGCDCDCVQQLEGALETIAKQGSGILFYLLQEGRGVGYLAKSRDRMLVQATEDKISTFEAYKILGLKEDYRQYRDIISICQVLGISPRFILLTNNPQKLDALRTLGAEISRTESIEYEPNPYNLTYLKSKADAGHSLKKTRIILRSVIPPEPVTPFKPHSIQGAGRFIYVASYFLPIKPVSGEIILEEDDFRKTFSHRNIDSYMERGVGIIEDYKLLRNRRFLIKTRKKPLEEHLRKYPEDPLIEKLTSPYWFKVHVYTDIVTSEDYIVLTYGHPNPHEMPLVRIHSESIFNRFPSKNLDNREKFKEAIRQITHYGEGFIILLYNDGRGAGFAAYAQDQMLKEQGFSHSTDESYKQMGISYDRRDYEAVMLLLKHHLPAGPIQMILQEPASLVRKKDMIEALEHHCISVSKWIFLDEKGVID